MTTIRYKCDECGVAMKIKADLAGKKGKCPKCKKGFVVPGLEPPAPPEDDVPADVASAEEDDDWDDDEDDDDDEFLDMPMELTSAPVTAEAPAQMAPPKAKPRDRKAASETKKATRIPARPSKKGKGSGGKSKDGEFDPTDVLFGDDDDVGSGGSSAADSGEASAKPRGRVLGLDDEDDDAGQSRPKASMSELYKDFTPAGGSRRKIASEGASTSVAADALARKAEEKRNKSSQPPPEEDEGNDYVQDAKDLWDQFGLYIGGTLILVFGLYFGMNWILGSKPSDMPELHYVEGTVTLNGVAVAGADVFFTPPTNTAEDLLSNNSGAVVSTNAEGYYEVQYKEGYPGLPEGRYSVQVLQSGSMLGTKSVMVKPDLDNQINLQF